MPSLYLTLCFVLNLGLFRMFIIKLLMYKKQTLAVLGLLVTFSIGKWIIAKQKLEKKFPKKLVYDVNG